MKNKINILFSPIMILKKKYILTRHWITVFVLFAVTPIAFAQQKAKQIDDLMGRYVDNGKFNGSVLVVENGKVIFKKGYGLANMEWNIPNTPDTKFRLGSLTKQFTAMLIMQLVEQGKLKLEGKITDYLTDYPKAAGDKITIHHLLTHTSGIPNYTNLPAFKTFNRNRYKPADFLKQFSDLPLEFEPGSAFAYSNSGYFLLGAIIEKVTGKTYEKVLQENIFTPLQMNNTGYDMFFKILPKRATGYDRWNLEYENAPYLDMSIPYAAGSLYSTVEDLALWDQALYSDKLLSASSKAIMLTPYKSDYAYGWGVYKTQIAQLKDSVEAMGHQGGINGFNTSLIRIPKNKHLVVLLNNTGGTNLGAMQNNILKILYDQPFDLPKISVAYVLGKTLATTSLANALKRYAEIKKQPAYYLNEGEINGLGYGMIATGKIREAIAVFNLNVMEYPQSFNVWDSRGEAYMLNGEKTKAIMDYKKSLELDPYSMNAIRKLNELGEKVADPKEATVEDKILDTYVGKYQLTPSFVISITKEGARLYEQATGQPRHELYAESESKFFMKAIDGKILFVKNEQGSVEKLVLFQNGQEMQGKRVN
ncbi:serine hydrolase [Pseudoflavitalea sp. X16]|uniref:serine hydrolase n=1 Tax=Paraflavitalea devenefica TaxID=2716334 RepID=UPI0014247427|nr:serine hydrolase [Paraflavitalea devenefica]NII26468.1 serine hydrolase [Paraflavitalea devenefica]